MIMETVVCKKKKKNGTIVMYSDQIKVYGFLESVAFLWSQLKLQS